MNWNPASSSVKMGNKAKMSLSPLPFIIILEILANAIRYQKGKNRYTDCDVRNKLNLLTEGMIF